MTKSIETAIKAINKWVFFGWNYSCVHHEWISVNGEKKCEAVPQFLAEVKWTCNFDHMLSKWHLATRDGNADSYLVKFYAELGAENRLLLLEWVMQNYDDEQKIWNKDDIDKCPEAKTLAKIREWAEDTSTDYNSLFAIAGLKIEDYESINEDGETEYDWDQATEDFMDWWNSMDDIDQVEEYRKYQ